MQIDFQKPMRIDSVIWQTRLLTFKQEGDVYLADFEKDLEIGKQTSASLGGLRDWF